MGVGPHGTFRPIERDDTIEHPRAPATRAPRRRPKLNAKAARILRESGSRGLVARTIALAYRRGIRPWLPRGGAVHYAGLPTALHRKWLDRIVPLLWTAAETVDIPDYEAALVSAIREHVRAGDRVVVVGGGIGVTATMAALMTGPAGSVHCFEGAAECVEKVRRTADANAVGDRVSVDHAVVGRAILVYGTVPDHAIVRPEELPECDVLELDCEGAEIEILRHMTVRPRAVLVEAHGLHGAPTEAVLALLRQLGYRATVVGLAEPRLAEFCQAGDIRVVAGVRSDAVESA